MRPKDVRHGKRDSYKATNKLFTLWIGRIDTLESELTFAGGQLGSTKMHRFDRQQVFPWYPHKSGSRVANL